MVLHGNCPGSGDDSGRLEERGSWANPVSLRRGLKTIDKLVEETAVAKPVEGRSRVATVSAGNDEEVGTMIAEAMQSHQRRCDYR